MSHSIELKYLPKQTIAELYENAARDNEQQMFKILDHEAEIQNAKKVMESNRVIMDAIDAYHKSLDAHLIPTPNYDAYKKDWTWKEKIKYVLMHPDEFGFIKAAKDVQSALEKKEPMIENVGNAGPVLSDMVRERDVLKYENLNKPAGDRMLYLHADMLVYGNIKEEYIDYMPIDWHEYVLYTQKTNRVIIHTKAAS